MEYNIHSVNNAGLGVGFSSQELVWDFSGTAYMFQNRKITTISNMTKDWSAMVFDIGVAYKENLEKVMELMKQLVEQLKEDK
jgi:small conductance mechanosensitive channel